MSGSLNLDNAGILQYSGSGGASFNVISPNSTGSLPVINHTCPTVTASGAVNTQLTVAQSGSVVLVPVQTASVIIGLPIIAGSAGVKYRILFQAPSAGGGFTQTVQIGVGAGVANLAGQVMNLAAAALTSALLPTTTIVRTATAANTKAGDYIDCFCDGTNWQCNGVGFGAGATYTIS